MVFHHKLFFNLVKELFKRSEGLGKSFAVQVKSDRERVIDLVGIRRKLDTLSNLAPKKLAIQFFYINCFST